MAVAVALFVRLLGVGADPPICLAPAACEEVVIGALFNEGVSGTALATTRLAIEDVNGDANVLPHTHLVLLESSLVPLHAAVATADCARAPPARQGLTSNTDRSWRWPSCSAAMPS